MADPLSGACMCGRIQYEIRGRPRFMYQCHCGKCRAGTGASFATNLIVDADKLEITAGQDSLACWESSPRKFRHFCGACGSPIYSQGEKTKHVVSVRTGTLKQDPGMRVAYHAFVGSKAPWVEITDGQPQFDEWADPELVKRLFHNQG
jgi:hypothetical protein